MNDDKKMRTPESAAPTGLIQQGDAISTTGVRIWDSGRRVPFQPQRIVIRKGLLDFDVFDFKPW